MLDVVRGQAGEELTALLPTVGRALPVPFQAYSLVNPSRRFRGRISARVDVEKAYRQSRLDEQTGGRLLIVGDPGSGKTIALLEILEFLCERAAADPTGPVPVTLSLGGWDASLSIHDWAVRTLTAATGVLAGADELADRWLREGILAPLFDGLDEIPNEDERKQCLNALNAYARAAPASVPVVVACRVEDYEKLVEGRPAAERLAVNAAICLQPLEVKEVRDYVQHLAERDATWAARAAALVRRLERDHGDPLAELLRLPLWLSLLERAPEALDALTQAASAEEATATLLDGFLEQSLRRVDPKDSRKWTATIAGFLRATDSPNSTTFYLEDLTGLGVPRSLRVVAGLATGLVAGLGVWLIFGRAAFGKAAGGILGPILGLLLGQNGYAWPTRSKIGWPGSWSMCRYLAAGLIMGFFIGASLQRLLDPIGPIAGVAGGLFIGLASGLVRTAPATGRSSAPDAGWHNSRRSVGLRGALFGLSLALIGGLVGMVARGLVRGVAGGLAGGLIVGLGLGLAIGLNQGGWYLIQQYRVRRQAARRGLLPPHLVRFLDTLSAVGVLRRAGGGYRFRHRAILDRLASEAPTSELMRLRHWADAGRDPLSRLRQGPPD